VVHEIQRFLLIGSIVNHFDDNGLRSMAQFFSKIVARFFEPNAGTGEGVTAAETEMPTPAA
jgi:hypothetical protein